MKIFLNTEYFNLGLERPEFVCNILGNSLFLFDVSHAKTNKFNVLYILNIFIILYKSLLLSNLNSHLTVDVFGLKSDGRLARIQIK